MWLFALAAMGILVGVFFGFAALKNMKTKPAWVDAEGNEGSSVASRKQRRRADSDTVSQTATELVADVEKDNGPRKELWIDATYFWVVVCKNDGFHQNSNIYNVHRIPLGETDAVASRPPVGDSFAVRCAECGKEYTYKSSEVLRYEMEVPAPFVPHPLFRE